MEEVEWAYIPEFPNYQVSDLGMIYNCRTRRFMQFSLTRHGNVKVNLVNENGAFTRSVPLIVAQTFVSPPNSKCDTVVALDGDLTNVEANNLIWRPRWFAWKYVRQLKLPIPNHYMNLRVTDIDTGVEYKNIFEAAITEGLLFESIWRSTFRDDYVYPIGHRFIISGKGTS